MESFLGFVFFVVVGAATALLAYGLPAALLWLCLAGMLTCIRQSIVEEGE